MNITKEGAEQMQAKVDALAKKKSNHISVGGFTAKEFLDIYHKTGICPIQSTPTHPFRIRIKPLSVNLAWQGKRFKTKLYKQYEADLLNLLPKLILPKSPYKLTLEFGFSNRASDLDNPAKCLIDILQKKYHFNDKDIYQLNITKTIVKKLAEYISFKIESL